MHRLGKGDALVLGGIRIPSDRKAIGHSDADVLIHAICDALLGAASLGDIGRHFPDTSSEYRDIDSKVLLKKVMDLLAEKGYAVSNVDCTVCLESPKIGPHVEEMKKVLAGVMLVTEEDVSIKATTSEKLGYVGRAEGVAAYAVALISK